MCERELYEREFCVCVCERVRVVCMRERELCV